MYSDGTPNELGVGEVVKFFYKKLRMKKISHRKLLFIFAIIYCLLFIPSALEIIKRLCDGCETSVEVNLGYILGNFPDWMLNIITFGGTIITIASFALSIKQGIEASENAMKAEDAAQKANEAKIEAVQKIERYLSNKQQLNDNLSYKVKFEDLRIKITLLVKKKKSVKTNDNILNDIYDILRKINENPLEKSVEQEIEQILSTYGKDFTFEELKELEKQINSILKYFNGKIGG